MFTCELVDLRDYIIMMFSVLLTLYEGIHRSPVDSLKQGQ